MHFRKLEPVTFWGPFIGAISDADLSLTGKLFALPWQSMRGLKTYFVVRVSLEVDSCFRYDFFALYLGVTLLARRDIFLMYLL